MAADGRPEDVEAWLARVPAERRDKAQELREAIRSAAPEAVEGLSYSVPAFRYRGRPLVAYAPSKEHLGFYVMSPAVVEAHAELLKGYSMSKGTIRLAYEAPVPADLVTTLVKARMAETDAAEEAKRAKRRKAGGQL